MNRAVIATAGVLLGLGGILFFTKHLILEMPIIPDTGARVWRVDLRVDFEGDGGTTKIELEIPTPTGRQAILDEETLDSGLRFERADVRGGGQRAQWSGTVSGERSIVYSLRVHLPRESTSGLEPSPPLDSIPGEEEGAIERIIAPRDIVFRKRLDRLGIEDGDRPEAVIASVFGFVAHDIATTSQGSEDPRNVLAEREGTLEGRTRLLFELLRTAGLDARTARGFRLPRAGEIKLESYVEVETESRTVRLMLSTGEPHLFPQDFLTLSRNARPILSASGVTRSALSATTLRESIRAEEMASFVSPHSAIARALSLYRLPISTRTVLRTLLVIPLAVLIAAVFRNLLGIKTFGTFMPVLIALSLREIGLFAGIILVASCLIVGVIGRLLLDRLRLLFVPRVCLLLCLVVIAVTVLAQIGHSFGLDDLGKGLLFPIVILAMLIERISVTTLEEGWESSAKLLLGSLLLAAANYPIFRSDFLAHLFFGFPELILCVMGLLVLVGGYTGYRVSELWRFRSLIPKDATQQ